MSVNPVSIVLRFLVTLSDADENKVNLKTPPQWAMFGCLTVEGLFLIPMLWILLTNIGLNT